MAKVKTPNNFLLRDFRENVLFYIDHIKNNKIKPTETYIYQDHLFFTPNEFDYDLKVILEKYQIKMILKKTTIIYITSENNTYYSYEFGVVER